MRRKFPGRRNYFSKDLIETKKAQQVLKTEYFCMTGTYSVKRRQRKLGKWEKQTGLVS